MVASSYLNEAERRCSSALSVSRHWSAFQLHPSSMWEQMGAYKTGLPKREFYNRKFGENNWQPLIERMQRTFKDAGLEPMTLEGVVGPTFDSHRLIAVAERDFGESVQNALMEKLFYEYFIQGRNICTDLEVLTDCGRSVNIDNAADIVYGTDGTIEVQQQLDLAKRLEIKSVPTFIFEGSNGCTMFAGAQPVKSFERALRYVEPH